MNRDKTYHITTFGCQMNEHDSETMAGMLEDLGFSENLERNSADVVIINTCSVRENADKRFFGTLGQLKKIKKENPDFTVCVCGCMMQQQHIIDSIKSKYPWVDLIFGTHNIHEFPHLLKNVIEEREKLVHVWEDGGEIVEGLPAKRLYRHKAFVNIMYGCNNFCTYCIVPYTRGRERSRKPEDIVDEVKRLTADGVREVTLLGQNVNSYRGDGNTDFADLIYRLQDIEELKRIRFMTSHPKDLSDKLIQAYRDCDKLCNYIHLPVQSGSSRVLEQMNRKYTKEDYLELIEKLCHFLLKILLDLLTIVQWWNPVLIFFFLPAVHQIQELSTDAQLVRMTTQSQRSAYLSGLHKTLQYAKTKARFPQNIHFGLLPNRKKALIFQRFNYIKAAPARHNSILGVILCFVLFMLSFTFVLETSYPVRMDEAGDDSCTFKCCCYVTCPICAGAV